MYNVYLYNSRSVGPCGSCAIIVILFSPLDVVEGLQKCRLRTLIANGIDIVALLALPTDRPQRNQRSFVVLGCLYVVSQEESRRHNDGRGFHKASFRTHQGKKSPAPVNLNVECSSDVADKRQFLGQKLLKSLRAIIFKAQITSPDRRIKTTYWGLF
ncbi:hypothetical protein BC835DRAFT_1353065 [Cytidiella melzeri]|nr:hypothetical protein BC835DRAFT_1353065 [Cytidiella melzeri]